MNNPAYQLPASASADYFSACKKAASSSVFRLTLAAGRCKVSLSSRFFGRAFSRTAFLFSNSRCNHGKA